MIIDFFLSACFGGFLLTSTMYCVSKVKSKLANRVSDYYRHECHIPPKGLVPARACTLPDYVIQAGGRGQAHHLTQCPI